MAVPEPPVTPVLAATVVVLRPGDDGPEVLLTHRPATMAFAPDMHVFPGGRVDGADASDELAARSSLDRREASERLGNELDPAAALAAHVAAIRELWEEAGLLLADTTAPTSDLAEARVELLAGRVDFASVAAALELRLRTELLQPLSRWVTPPGYPRRFDARFFAASVPEEGLATVGGVEVTAVDWHRPTDALDAMADGRLGMWLPTSSTLQQLEHLRAVADLDRLRPGPPGSVTVDEPVPHLLRIVMPAGGGVSGQPVCSYLIGRSRLLLVDPGDPTGPALERCLAEASSRSATIEAIALTHVDPDHHAGAEALAERLHVPVYAGRGAGRRLPYEILEVSDDASLPDADLPVRVLATPGPRPDHLALLVGDAAVLTGDLDGRRGSRCIPGPADEAAWIASRTRVDALGPELPRLPGHPDGSHIGA